MHGSRRAWVDFLSKSWERRFVDARPTGEERKDPDSMISVRIDPFKKNKVLLIEG